MSGMLMNEKVRIGIDVGSTTAKIVVLSEDNSVIYSEYTRHNADVKNTILGFFTRLRGQLADAAAAIKFTGSAGMGVSERYGFPFIQEVLALNCFARRECSGLRTIIDIGGEDAKIVFLDDKALPDMRMNGNCAGGTGAFIDQMAAILGMTIAEMDAAAAKAERIHPIASRCGVFSKTDVQNLVAKNVAREEICASIFHAIAVQVVASLSRGRDITPKILFCGGPLTFIASLRRAFMDYLRLDDGDILHVENANILTAKGCALSIDAGGEYAYSIASLIELITNAPDVKVGTEQTLPPIFENDAEIASWRRRMAETGDLTAPLKDGDALVLGIDSGSTTTKIVLANMDGRIVFSDYSKNMGNPILAVRRGLEKFAARLKEDDLQCRIISGCSTGYGEELIKAAFGLNLSMVETMAHYTAAKRICPDVDFILDIGGQDMKAMFIEDGVLNRIELNEACSSGCGSFIETFANSLGFSAQEFSDRAVRSKAPCDLGTRCTVFMNSKIKQSMREGASVEDIAAGLAYSVVKNCFYKVLKIRDTNIGKHIVVQGGTMRNDAVVKALENIVGHEVYRNSMPELMGAYGCALYALEQIDAGTPVVELEVGREIDYDLSHTVCRGCENNCYIDIYNFRNGRRYYSGNKCEKVFSFRAKGEKGDNIYTYRRERVFTVPEVKNPVLRLGVPRVLNLYSDFPFWAAFFAELGIELVLSDISTYTTYEKQLREVMSDNICFPAKLVHSHIHNLCGKDIDRIFFPYVVYENKHDRTEANSYNCPIVSSYNTLIKNIYRGALPLDNPIFTLKDRALTVKNCIRYVSVLVEHVRREKSGVEFAPDRKSVERAVDVAFAALDRFHEDMRLKNGEFLAKAKSEGRLVVLLAGRPYHTDSLIQHKLSDMISDLGVTVVNEEIVDARADMKMEDTYILSQWNYINKIVKAAKWVGQQGDSVHYVQMTSFGCGPDAFLLDEVSNLLRRYHKSATIVKIDDINNLGSMKLRIRSLIESLKYKNGKRADVAPFVSTRLFTKEESHRVVLAPFFTEYFSPFLPELFEINGYHLEVLPMSDKESAEMGLQYANNEVCYPATLIVGDAIKALKSGKYNLADVAVGITQTGGQCRASNYYPIIKKALVDAGFADIPVISVSFGSGLSNNQPGFKINWLKSIPVTLSVMLYGDNLSKLYHATVVRTDNRTAVGELRDRYIAEAKPLVLKRDSDGLLRLLSSAVEEFNALLPVGRIEREKVGIVGEIFLKYHPFANKFTERWLIERNFEVIPPNLLTFFIQSFVNAETKKANDTDRIALPKPIMNFLYSLVKQRIRKFDRVMEQFRYFTPTEDVFDLAEDVKEILPLVVQFGEGWLLPAEIVAFAKQKVKAVLSLQPFGCIANHIISKGLENKIKQRYPGINILSLDFDSGVSEVNIENRLRLLLDAV